MREELKLENPEDGMSPLKQGVIVGFSALLGSFIPLVPFFFLPPLQAVAIALVASLIILFLVGAYKSKLTSGRWLQGGLELMLIGGAAALAGYVIGSVLRVRNP